MDDEIETPPPSKIKAIIPYVAVLVLGLGGGYGVSFAMGPKQAEPVDPEAAEGEASEGEAAEGEAAEGEAKAEGEEKGEGEHGGSEAGKAAFTAGMNGKSAVTNLGTFTVNLRGSGGGRVVRMEVQVDSAGKDAGTLGAKTPQLRDSVITAVSDYTWSELEGVDGKTRLRDELLQRVNGIAAPAEINALYFTQFVVQ